MPAPFFFYLPKWLLSLFPSPSLSLSLSSPSLSLSFFSTLNFIHKYIWWLWIFMVLLHHGFNSSPKNVVPIFFWGPGLASRWSSRASLWGVEPRQSCATLIGGGGVKNVCWGSIYVCIIYVFFSISKILWRKWFMYIHIYIWTYIYICTYIHIYICTYIHIYKYTCMHIYLCTYIHTFAYIYIYLHIFT